MKFLYELYKPSQDLQKARETLSKFDKVDSRDNSWQYTITDILKKYDFNKLGAGKYGTVYKNPKFNYVLKVFMKDAAFLKWFKFCNANKDNPYCPKFKGAIGKLTDNFYFIKVEELMPFKGSKDDMYVFNVDSSEHAQQIRKELEKNKKLLDLHDENIMMRGNQVVILDPYYNFYKNNQYTIDPDDFDYKNLT